MNGTNPYIDGPENESGVNYFSIGFNQTSAFVGVMSLIPEMCDIVNYSALVTFVDRVHADGVLTQPDPCAPPDPRENPETCDAYRQNGCEYFGLNNTGTATWGPDPDNPEMCITNAEGQNGRFPAAHGNPPGTVYISHAIRAHLETIRTEATGSCARQR